MVAREKDSNQDDAQVARRRLELASSLHWFHWVIISLSLLLTFIAWSYSKSQFNSRIESQFDREADQIIELVKERMQKYEDALWGGVALIQASGGDVDYDHWTKYAKSIRIEHKYPGINGIGVIHAITKEELPNYLAEQRRRRPDYAIHPPHEGDLYFPISYITPVEGNKQAVGLDMAHETNRFTAAKKSRDTGQSQITGPITLVQDGGKTPGFLFYAPFYEGGTYDSPEERQRNFSGMVYAPFVVMKLMEGALQKEKRRIGLRLVDGEDVLYDEHVSSEADFDPVPLFKRSVEIPVYGRKWTFDIRSASSFRSAATDNQPLTILIGGIFIDMLLVLLFVSISRTSKSALRDADSMTQRLGASTTELKENQAALAERAEQLELSDKYKSEFLANMSHELRTPLNSMLILLQLLSDNTDGNLTDNQLKCVRVIRDGGKDLLRSINDILDLSKVEAGMMDLDYENVNLAVIARAIVSQLASLANEKKLALEFECEEGVDLELYTDARRIGQVVRNLVSNSIKFTERGSVIVKIHRPDPQVLFHDKTLSNRNVIAISVTDTGIGISKEHQQAIFEAFRQADGSTSRRFGGTGLGLTIARKMTKLLGGELHVVSEEGEGSTFALYLPRNQVEQVSSRVDVSVPEIHSSLLEQKQLVEKRPNAAYERGDLQGHRVLVVDDDSRNAFAISSVLEQYGLDVVLADNGRRALEQLDTDGRIELVIMDVMMPLMDGYEATRAIRMQPRFENLPVIALTAKAMAEDKGKCLAAGADAYVTKPVEMAELVSLIAELLSQNRATDDSGADAPKSGLFRTASEGHGPTS